jgi:hypothetical protein
VSEIGFSSGNLVDPDIHRATGINERSQIRDCKAYMFKFANRGSSMWRNEKFEEQIVLQVLNQLIFNLNTKYLFCQSCRHHQTPL